MRSNRFRAGLLSCVVLFLPAPWGLASEPKVNGKLERIGLFNVLRVWGTPKEMGFAHGYLLGKGVLAETDASFEQIPAADRPSLDAAQTTLRTAIRVPDRLLEELQGIFEGVVAAHGGKPPLLTSLNRPMTVDDVVITNAGDMLRAFGCSGFTVWGDRAGDAGVITTRNFDFTLMTPKLLDSQFILVRQPKDRKQVALVTWYGFIGAVSGINELGVCTFMHDGTGRRLSAPEGKYTPVALAMIELLEQVTPAEAHTKFEAGLNTVTPYPFSYLLRVVSPRVPGKVDVPERVFHVDADGLGENRRGSSVCITTNHYVSPDGKPSPGAGVWSLTRFKRLEDRTAKPVTTEEAWEALRAVAAEAGQEGTLYSLVILPEKRMVELAFASLVNGNVQAAPSNEHVRMTFDELFAARH